MNTTRFQERNASICLDCRRAVPDADGCSWARAFEPVSGWRTVPGLKYRGKGETKATYRVLYCPLFWED